MIAINKTKLVDFAASADYAYLYGAGIMFANDNDTKSELSAILENAQNIEITNPQNDMASIELAECDCEALIVKAWNNNQEPLYISFYI